MRELLKEGVYVNPVISPAVPQGQYDQTSYTATHTREQMEGQQKNSSRSLQISRWTLISSVYRQRGAFNRFG